MLRLLALLLVLVTGSAACRPSAVEHIAHTTQLIDEQYSASYERAADECLSGSETRAEYDSCIAPWDAGADAVRAVRQAALTLDVVQGRKGFKALACDWFRAAAVVDAISPVDVPAARAAMLSRWNNRC